MSFVLSKVLWLLAEPGNALVIGLVTGAILLWTRWRRAGMAIVGTVTAVAVAVTVLPIGTYLVHGLESRFPVPTDLPERVDGIIVLGGAVLPRLTASHGVPQVNRHAERMLDPLWLARRFPEARLVFTGGSGNLWDQMNREAVDARLLWDRLGVDTARVTFESESRNTWENAVLTKELVRPAEGEIWLLVTSGFHMPRSVGIFRRIGWPVLPYPVDFQTRREVRFQLGFDLEQGISLLNLATREHIGLVAYHLMGRTDAWFPAPEPAQ
ncbi:YdcF family protein [Aerophototrophica crusticola]|uniref:YdcF family protein n=1 Tax=Aerophototrophica crusticola TaxID=1709002 RepID=A0A858R6K2_9PROT|nr:YdcF family protein [Rhodospirillaceae bacterium B3]